mgnify:CR=1 FL=1
MTIKATASYNNKVTYTITETCGNDSSTRQDTRTITTSYTHGTGDSQINNGVTISGTLTASQSKQLDLYQNGTGVLFVQFGITGGVPIDRMKHCSVYNLETTEGANIEISNTGTYGLTNLVGSAHSSGGSGTQLIRPYSSFTFNDPFQGVSIEDESKYIYVNDVAGSGAKFAILIMGVDESQPTGTDTCGSPYG